MPRSLASRAPARVVRATGSSLWKMRAIAAAPHVSAAARRSSGLSPVITSTQPNAAPMTSAGRDTTGFTAWRSTPKTIACSARAAETRTAARLRARPVAGKWTRGG
eukprot:6570197-Prymnesium_polylepis.1